MISRLTLATFCALAASGLILAAPGKAPWVVWLAHSVALGALGVAGWLVIRGWREVSNKSFNNGVMPTDASSVGRLLTALHWLRSRWTWYRPLA